MQEIKEVIVFAMENQEIKDKREEKSQPAPPSGTPIVPAQQTQTESEQNEAPEAKQGAEPKQASVSKQAVDIRQTSAVKQAAEASQTQEPKQAANSPYQNAHQQTISALSNKSKEEQSISKLFLAANILGPVSLLVGGVLASAGGLTCAIIGRVKAARMAQSKGAQAKAGEQLVRNANISIVICAVALIINIVVLVISLMTFINILESGQLANLLGEVDGGQSILGSSGSSGSQGSSTWG